MSDDTTKKTTENSQETAQEKVKEQAEVVEETTPEVTEEAAETSDESEIAEVETPEVENPAKEKETKIPEFRAGDTVKVHYKIIEGGKVRIQPYEGIVISRRGEGMSKTFIVRRIGADNIGVERIFPLYSPNIEKIEVKKRGKVRRAKLYYLRTKKGREAMRIKEVK